MRDRIVVFLAARRERRVWLEWLRDEMKLYTDEKFNANEEWWPTRDEWTRGGVGNDSEWMRQITQYLGRAEALGLDTPQGRQAVFKSFATYVGLIESVICVHGDPPPPGVPSGEIR